MNSPHGGGANPPRGSSRNGPIGGDCDKPGCKRVAYDRVGSLKVCGDHHEWAAERSGVSDT